MPSFLLSPSSSVLPGIVEDEGDVRENFFPRTQLMRSLSFLLVTYYTVLRLFVTQIVLDVPTHPPVRHPLPLPRWAVAVAGELGRLKIAWLAKLTMKRGSAQRQNERQREELLIQDQRH